MIGKRVYCVVLCALLLWGCGQQPQQESAPETTAPTQRTGIAFEKESAWRTRDTVQQTMDTMELWLQVSGVKADGEVLLTTYGNGAPYVELLLNEEGNPVLRQGLTSDQALDHTFRKVDVRGDRWVHLAVIRDRKAGKLFCYVNGECRDTISAIHMSDVLPVRPLCVGSDHSAGNLRFFSGRISSVAVFAGARTEAQLQADMTAPAGDDLLYYYELDGAADRVQDLSGNQRELVKSQRWISEKAPAEGYAYSFAVIGDTQKVAVTDPDRFHLITDYILANVEDKNIRFVMGLGDITDTSSEAEWQAAMAAYHSLDGVVPYSLARGNDSHDSVATFQAYVSYDAYGDRATGTMEQDMRNAYYCFAVGSVKYMVLVLDCAPTDAMLDWANQVVASYPDHNVIVTTHMYLYRDGTTLDDSDPYKIDTNNGAEIWEKFLRRHENILLVLCGHDPTSQVVKSQQVGDHGNVVTQMMLDPQAVDLTEGSTGLVALFYFSQDGKQVAMDYYSPLKGQYFLTENQFTFTLDTVE